MAFNKEQLQQMCKDRNLEFNEETTVNQLEEMLSQPAGLPQNDQAPQPQGREDLNDPAPKNEDEKSSDEDGAENSENSNENDGKNDGDPQSEPTDKPEKEDEEKEDTVNDTPPVPQGRDAKGKVDDKDEEDEPPVVKDITKLHNADIAFMKEWVWDQPQVRFMIPLSEGEKPGAYDTWQRNGYRLEIMKGVFIDLPEPVANDLATHYNLDMETGKDFRLDLNANKQKALQ